MSKHTLIVRPSWRNFIAGDDDTTLIVVAIKNETTRINLRDMNLSIQGAIPHDDAVLLDNNNFQGGFNMTPEIVQPPSFGALDVAYNLRDLDYTPPVNYTGSDCIVFRLVTPTGQKSHYYRVIIDIVNSVPVPVFPEPEIDPGTLVPVQSEWMTYQFGLGYWYNNEPQPALPESGLLPQYASWDTTYTYINDKQELPPRLIRYMEEDQVSGYMDTGLKLSGLYITYDLENAFYLELENEVEVLVAPIESADVKRSMAVGSISVNSGKHSWEIKANTEFLVNPTTEHARFGIVTDDFVTTPTDNIKDPMSPLYANPDAQAIFISGDFYDESKDRTWNVWKNGTIIDTVSTEVRFRVRPTANHFTCLYDADNGILNIYFEDELLCTVPGIDTSLSWKPAVFDKFYGSGNFGQFRFKYPELVPPEYNFGIYNEVDPLTVTLNPSIASERYDYTHSNIYSCEAAGFVWFDGACYRESPVSLPDEKMYQVTSSSWCESLGGHWENNYCWRDTNQTYTSCIPWDPNLDTLAASLLHPNSVAEIENSSQEVRTSPPKDSFRSRVRTAAGTGAFRFAYRITKDMITTIDPGLDFNLMQLKIAIESYFTTNYPLVDGPNEFLDGVHPYVHAIHLVDTAKVAVRDIHVEGNPHVGDQNIVPWQMGVQEIGTDIKVILDQERWQPEQIVDAVIDIITLRGAEGVGGVQAEVDPVDYLSRPPETAYDNNEVIFAWDSKVSNDPAIFDMIEDFTTNTFSKIIPSHTFRWTTNQDEANLIVDFLSYQDFPLFGVAGFADVGFMVMNGGIGNIGDQILVFLHELLHALDLQHLLDIQFSTNQSILDYTTGAVSLTIADIVACHVFFDERIPNGMSPEDLRTLLEQDNYRYVNQFLDEFRQVIDARDNRHINITYDFETGDNNGFADNPTASISPAMYDGLELIVDIWYASTYDDPNGFNTIPFQGDPHDLCI